MFSENIIALNEQTNQTVSGGNLIPWDALVVIT